MLSLRGTKGTLWFTLTVASVKMVGKQEANTCSVTRKCRNMMQVFSFQLLPRALRDRRWRTFCRLSITGRPLTLRGEDEEDVKQHDDGKKRATPTWSTFGISHCRSLQVWVAHHSFPAWSDNCTEMTVGRVTCFPPPPHTDAHAAVCSDVAPHVHAVRNVLE